MIKKCLPFILIIVLLISGCNTTVMKNANGSIVKNSENNKPSTQINDSERVTNLDEDIQLEYPSKILYPSMKQVSFIIKSFPQIAAICRITALGGELSISKLFLSDDDDNQFIYYFPDTAKPLQVDSIIIAFYDEHGKSISNKRYILEYLEENKEYWVMEAPN